MTKAELVKTYQEATGLGAAQAGEYLNRLGDIMAAELLGGGEVPLPSIGKLVIKKVPARQGRNPRTGMSIEVPAKTKVALRVGKDLKESLNS